MESSDRYWLSVTGMSMIFVFAIGFLIYLNSEKQRQFDLEAIKAGAVIKRYDMNGRINEEIDSAKIKETP
jgi:hypothetical protein